MLHATYIHVLIGMEVFYQVPLQIIILLLTTTTTATTSGLRTFFEKSAYHGIGPEVLVRHH